MMFPFPQARTHEVTDLIDILLKIILNSKKFLNLFLFPRN